MCFGGGGSKKAPPPAQPTKFEYGPADYSNSQRQTAALTQDAPSAASYGSELGSGGTTPAATTQAQ